MKLKKLYSNNPKFKTIKFNPGLNIIAGMQKTDEYKETFNGVGKSISLLLVHLILGSSLRVQENKLKDFLSRYGIFHLDIEVRKQNYTFSKNFAETNYYINNKKMKKTEYIAALEEIFATNELGISFRQAFNCFARRFGGAYYNTYVLTQQGRQLEEFNQRIVNFKLLGVNTELVERKRNIKEKIDKNKKYYDSYKEYHHGQNRAKLNDLNDEISKLQNAISNFKIAKNYELLKSNADKLTEQLNEVRNKIYWLNHKKQRLSENLKLINDYKEIKPREILNVYEEAQFHFEDKIVKRLEEAQKYHITLLENRRERLNHEIQKIDDEIQINNQEKEEISNKRDSLLNKLDNSGALEEYHSLIEHKRELQSERDKINYNIEEIEKLERERIELKRENLEIQAESITYINTFANEMKKKEDIFRDLVKRFYETQGGSLELSPTKDAKYLFDIDVQMPRERSQGVGEVKIFCYDVLLYLLNKNILNFLAHDGCIFSGMDPRQIRTIFKVILELISEYNLQYFVNINQNSLNEILEENDDTLTHEEKQQIKEGIRLELYDKNPENWLFGEQFD